MAHDVFISYSARDKAIADAVCATLENRKIRCWIAPRDVLPGEAWASTLIDAIDKSRVFILVFSDGANKSRQVIREVGEAVDRGIPVIPFRVEDVQPSKELGYYIKPIHWLDALTPPLEKHLGRLAETVEAVLQAGGQPESPPTPPAGPERPPTPPPAPRLLPRPLRPALVVALLLIVAALVLLWWFGIRPRSEAVPPTLTRQMASLLTPAPTSAEIIAASPLSRFTPTMTPTTMARPTATPTPTVAWISIVQRFAAPGHLAEGIAWDGAHLWLADNSGTLFQVDPSGTLLDAFQAPEVTPQGLTWDGTGFWLFTTNHGFIYRFRFEGREPKTLSSFQSPAQVFGGDITNDLSWDGQALWYANQYHVYRLDATGGILSTFAYPKNVLGLEWDGSCLWVAYHEFPSPSVLALLDAQGRELASFPSPVYQIEGLAWGDGYLWAIGRDTLAGELAVYRLNVALAKAEAHARSSGSDWQARVSSARRAYFLEEKRPGQSGAQPPLQHIAGIGRVFVVVELGLNNPTAGAILNLEDISIVDNRGQVYAPSGIRISATPMPEEYAVGQVEGKIIMSRLKPPGLQLVYEVKSTSEGVSFSHQGDVDIPSFDGQWPELTLAWLVPSEADELRLQVPGAPAIDLAGLLLPTSTETAAPTRSPQPTPQPATPTPTPEAVPTAAAASPTAVGLPSSRFIFVPEAVVSEFFAPGPDPAALAVAGDTLWVADGQQQRLYQLDRIGTPLASFPITFTNPIRGLAWDGATLLLTLSDYPGNRVVRLDPTGTVLESFPQPRGITAVQARDPADGAVWEYRGEFLLRFSADGASLQTFHAPIFGSAEALAWAPDGLWAVNTFGTWYRLNFSGELLREGSLGIGAFPYYPILAFDRQGYLWLALPNERKVYQLSLRQEEVPLKPTSTPGKGGERMLPRPQIEPLSLGDKALVRVTNNLQGPMTLSFGDESAILKPGDTWSAELDEGVYTVFASANVPEPIAFSGQELLVEGYEYIWVLSRPR
ncbi:MAG: TIR domain-containing protein [Anaerolineae bacterium]|nr:TIR domain-containing protein [Anaerolineae bacterium]